VTDDPNQSTPPPLGIETLGEAVCRSVIPTVPAVVELDLPGGMPDPRRADRWKVSARPRRDGVEVVVHRLVPYPADPHTIASPGYAAEVTDTLRQAIIGALTAAGMDTSAYAEQQIVGPQEPTPRR
jgi:hypothetical protein